MCSMQYKRVVYSVQCAVCSMKCTATATATDPPPANSRTIHRRLFYNDSKTKIKSENKGPILPLNFCYIKPKLLIHSSTRNLYSIEKQNFQEGTDIQITVGHHNYRQNWPRGRFIENSSVTYLQKTKILILRLNYKRVLKGIHSLKKILSQQIGLDLTSSGTPQLTLKATSLNSQGLKCPIKIRPSPLLESATPDAVERLQWRRSTASGVALSNRGVGPYIRLCFSTQLFKEGAVRGS